MNSIRQKMLEEERAIKDNIKKELKDEFPQLTESQLDRLTSLIWNDSHAFGEFEACTDKYIDIIEIVLEKESNL